MEYDDNIFEMKEFKEFCHLQSRLISVAMLQIGVYPGQAACISVLFRMEGITQSELADKLRIGRPTVTTMLQKMEKGGLLLRVIDKNDQRMTRLYLTDEGRRLGNAICKIKGKIDKITLANLNEDDKKQFLRLIRIMTDNLRKAIYELEEDSD